MRGRKRFHCHIVCNMKYVEWKRGKKNRPLLYISETLNNCKAHPLVLLAADVSALKPLKDFSFWQNPKTLQCSSYTHPLLYFKL